MVNGQFAQPPNPHSADLERSRSAAFRGHEQDHLDRRRCARAVRGHAHDLDARGYQPAPDQEPDISWTVRLACDVEPPLSAEPIGTGRLASPIFWLGVVFTFVLAVLRNPREAVHMWAKPEHFLAFGVRTAMAVWAHSSASSVLVPEQLKLTPGEPGVGSTSSA